MIKSYEVMGKRSILLKNLETDFFFFLILWLIYYELKNQICDGISLIHLISDLQVSMVVIRGDVNNGL